MHPLLGELDSDSGEPVSTIEREAVVEAEDELLPKLKPAQAISTYCDSCGGVDEHMPGCPVTRPPQEFVDFTQPDPGPLRPLRLALGRVLSKLAKKVSGK